MLARARHGTFGGHTSFREAPAEEVNWPILCGSSLEHVGHMPSLFSWGRGVFEEQFLLELVLGANPCERTLEAVLLPIISSYF